jgi:hypothetical protein
LLALQRQGPPSERLPQEGDGLTRKQDGQQFADQDGEDRHIRDSAQEERKRTAQGYGDETL